MKTILKVLIISGVIVSNFQQALAQTSSISSQAENVRSYSELIRAAGQYEYNLAQARLLYAQAELTTAQAAGEWQRARELQLLVHRLQVQIRRTMQDESRLRREIQTIEERAISAHVILSGKVTPRSLTALNYLIIRVVEPATTVAMMTEPVGTIASDEFIGTRAEVSFTGENVGQLIDHLRTNQLAVKPWGVAHTAVAQLLVKIDDDIAAKVEQTQERIHDIQNSLNPFLLPDRVPSVPANPAK